MSDGQARRLRQAWESTTGDDLLSRLTRASLLSAAERDSTLRTVADELRTPVERVVLEIHVSGRTVVEHEAPAKAVGRLLQRTSRAVNELAKQTVGAARRAEGLMTSALAPGSVRVTLVAPRAPTPKDDPVHTDALDIGEPQTPEGVALVELASLMNRASQGDVGDLHAAVHGLRAAPRDAVRMVARTLAKEGWEVRGELKIPGQAAVPVLMSADGAALLEDAATDVGEVIERETIPGHVDGWVWTTGTLTFVPEGSRRTIHAIVPPEMQSDVASLNARRAGGIASFSVLRRFPVGDSSSPSLSFALTAFQEDPEIAPLPEVHWIEVQRSEPPDHSAPPQIEP